MKMNNKNKLKDFFFLFRVFWRHGKTYVLLNCFLAVFANVISVITSTCMNRDIINAILDQKSLINVICIAIYYQLLYVVTNIVDTSVTMCVLNKKFVKISAELNKYVFQKALITSYSNMDNPTFYDNYSWTIKEFVGQSDNAVELMKKILVSLFSLATLFAILSNSGWFVLMITILYLIIIIPLDYNLSKLNIEKKKEMQQHNRKLDYVQRVFYLKDYAQVLKISLMPIHLFKWFDNTVSDKLKSQGKYNGKISLISTCQVALQHICTIGVMCFYIWQIYKGSIGVGDFVATVSAATLLRKTFYNFTSHYKNFNDISLSANKIRSFFDASTEENLENAIILPSSPCSVRFSNVSFFYPNTNIGVSNLTFDINPGEKIAIVGSNGAGKTTLVKLLLRLYNPHQGEILINGQPISEYDLYQYRLSTGVALQETSIFALSIRDNFSRYEHMNDAQIGETLTNLSLDRVIKQSKGDYLTPFLRDFDKNGIELSGGERQKIAIGALLNKKFPLLILDEPTSALDPLAEFELNQVITAKSLQSTTIIISHRLAAIKNVDRILVMDNGRIVEQGTHQELYDKRSFYYEMYTKQSSLYN